MNPLSKTLKENVESFREIWQGGYFEGDPLDPLGRSYYGELGYLSSLHAQYLGCIKPYLGSDSVVCEIGCGRGAWTKTFLPAKEVWCLDVVPPEHNGFWEYVGRHENVRYLQVDDFSCRCLPDDYFTYLFSFGCLCHVPFEGTSEYMRNMYGKLKAASHGFILVGDYDKYNRAVANFNQFSVNVRATPRRLRWLLKAYVMGHELLWPTSLRNKAEEDHHVPGRWYHAGTDATCQMLERIGYRIVDSDVGFNLRDPVIHFMKPEGR